MAMTLWTTAALVIWLVLWSIGQKAMDSFILAALIIIVGATLEILKRYLPNRDDA
jgi:hypothetical protein